MGMVRPNHAANSIASFPVECGLHETRILMGALGSFWRRNAEAVSEFFFAINASTYKEVKKMNEESKQFLASLSH